MSQSVRHRGSIHAAPNRGVHSVPQQHRLLVPTIRTENAWREKDWRGTGTGGKRGHSSFQSFRDLNKMNFPFSS